MADSGGSSKIALFIEALLDNESVQKFVAGVREGAKQAASEMEDSFKKQEEAEKRGGDTGRKVKGEQKALFQDLKSEATGMIVQYFALSQAIEFVGDSFRKALAEQKLNAQIIGNVQGLTEATEAQAAATVEWLDAVELASAIDKQRLVPALNDMMAATGNLAQSQQLLAIAAGASARGLGEFEMNAKALAMVLETGVIPKKTAFGKELQKLVTKTGSLNEALAEMKKRYGDAGEGVDSAAMKQERAKVQWDNAKEAIGNTFVVIAEKLLPIMEPLAMGIAMVVGGAMKLGAAVVGLTKIYIEFYKVLFENIVPIFKGLAQAMTGDLVGAYNTFHDVVGKGFNAMATTAKDSWATFQQTNDEVDTMLDGVSDSFAKFNAGAAGRTIGGAPGTFKPGGAPGGGEATKTEVNLGTSAGNIQGRDWETIQKQQQRAQEDMLENERLHLDLEAKSEEEYTKGYIEILKRREALYADGSSEQLRIAIERQKAERGLQDSADAQKKAAQQKLLQGLAPGSVAYFKELQRQYAEDAKSYAKGTQAKADAEKKLTDVTKKLNKAKVDSAMQAARGMVGAARGAFGERKEFAIAEAMINTYESATGAFQAMSAIPMVGPVLGAAAAAMAIMTGLKNVQEIKNQDKTAGKGFDDPQNDLVAELGGQRWARDFTARWQSGASRGFNREMAGGGGSGVVNNYTSNQPGQTVRTTNISVGAVPLMDSGKDSAMRELAEGLRTYTSLDNERDVR